MESMSQNAPLPPKKSTAGLIIAAIVGGGAVVLTAVSTPFLTPALRKVCLPYVPATRAQVNNIFDALEKHRVRKSRLIDLGSGDGIIVHEAARRGYAAVGVELNPWLVLYSKLRASREKFAGSAAFFRKNIWNTPLASYNAVVIFGVDTMMPDLERKCASEMEVGSVVVACRFPLPNSQPLISIGEGLDTVWLYEMKTTTEKS